MENKFFIGQKIVAVKDHSLRKFKKGDVFTVLDTKKMCCIPSVRINTNFVDNLVIRTHCTCGRSEINKHPFYSENCFAPFQEISDMTFEEAIELVTEKIFV